MRKLALLPALALLAAGCPPAGGVEIMPLDDQRVRVNDTLLLDLRVRTAIAGAEWSYSAPSVPDIGRTANLYPAGSAATFYWAPLATHSGTHQITFTVTAGGVSDSETINIEVIQAGGAPRFIQPPTGGTYDLSRSPEVVVNIQVVDEDSLSVTIGEREPLIEGGTITNLGSYSAEWRWRPSPAQVDERIQYTLRLYASDGSHEARADYAIVLLTEGREDCPGAPPQVSGMSPSSGEVLATVRDYEVTATITDDTGFKDAPLLYYTTEAPADMSRPDLTDPSLRHVPFLPLGGGRYHAFVPNLRLGPGEEQDVFFFVVAIDNDDAEGSACDHRTVGPVGRIRAASPSTPDPGGYCDQCSNDGQCQGGLCIAASPYGFCGVDCGAGCGSGGECRAVTSVGGVADDQCAPPEGATCSGGGDQCVPDANEPNDDETSATPMEVGSTVEGTICADDFDAFAVTLAAGQRYEVTATGWDPSLGDLDIDLSDPDGLIVAYGWGSTDTETFQTCTEVAGQHFVWVYGYDETTTGDYLLEIREVAGSCCDDDPHEENDSAAAGATISCGVGAEARVCEGDEDWFCFSVSAASTVTVTMVCDTGSGDLDLEVYDEAGTRLGRDLGTRCDSEVEVSLPAAGRYCARVRGFSGAVGSYLIDCEVSAGTTCASTAVCPSGRVCDPASGCVDDFCDEPGGTTGVCPSGHFCPEPGGTSADSDCADTCTSSATCRAGYSCKIFDEGRGCGLAGSGQTGQPCGSFRDCAGERTCLTAGATGYCAEINCTSTSDCPTDDHTGASRQARCVDVGGGQRICLMDCLFGDSQCDINPGTCRDTRDVGGAAVWVCALSSHTVPPQ